MAVVLDWDADHSAENLFSHGVSLSEAATTFGDERQLIDPWPILSDSQRLLGTSDVSRLLLTEFHVSDHIISLDSSRLATDEERELYASE